MATWYEPISGALSGLRTGAINTIGAIPNAFVRGVNVVGENYKIAQQDNPNLLPRIPNVPLSDDVLKTEKDKWVEAWQWNQNKRNDPYTQGPLFYTLDNTAAYLGRYPIKTIGAGLGGYVLDQWLNKPVEGLIDTVTFNALNLRPDEKPRQQDVFYPAVPTLTAEDLAYQIKRQQGNMAVTALTLQELQRIQQLQSGMPLQTLQPVDYGY